MDSVLSKLNLDNLNSTMDSVLSKLSLDNLNTTLALLGTVSTITLTYILVNWFKQLRYFKNLSITPGPTPFPIIGNLYGVVTQTLPIYDLSLVKKYGKIVGYFEGTTPIIMCADTKLLKNVLIKDFNTFRNRRVFESFLIDPIDKFMTVLKDDEWKNVRSIVTTTFTTGKLKSMSKIMQPASKMVLKYSDKLIEKDEIFDTKHVFGCYTLDVISTCCFGVQTNAIDDPDNIFIKYLKKMFANTLSSKLILLFIAPKFCKFAASKGLIEFFPMDGLNFFKDFSEKMMERRRAKLEYRDDFLQHMVDHEENETMSKDNIDSNSEVNYDNDNIIHNWKSTKKTLSNNEILSQEILFLAAGSETTALTMTLIAYNLAMNQDCQQKALNEIDNALEEHTEVNYDMIQNLPYLDMVINETLRMFPAAVRTDRVANADYEYEQIKIPKGSIFTILIYAIHHDPEIYPEPDKFIPERFTPEERKKRVNESFLPFGDGPRNCIGMRFALMEIKILLSNLLSKYTFHPCEKTLDKIVLDNSGFSRPKDPIYLKIKSR